MYGGRGGGRDRGRGRGGAGRDRGGGRGRSSGGGFGPRLPSALVQELGGGDAGGSGGFGGGFSGGRGGGRGGRGGGSSRGGGRGGAFGRGGDGAGRAGRGRGGDGGLKRRTEAPAEGPSSGGRGGERKDAPPQGRPAKRPRQQATDASAGGARGATPAGGLTKTLAAMRQRQAAAAGGDGGGGGGGGAGGGGDRGRPGGAAGGASSKTRFHELLVDGWESRNGREAFLEELRLQARLAKRLGKSKKDALDGLDKLTGWVSAGSGSMLPKYLDPVARKEAAELLAKAGSGKAQDPDADPILRAKDLSSSKLGSGGGGPGAAAAARRAAELLDRESDEELEFLGIDPGTRDLDDDAEEEDHGLDSGSGSGSEDEGEDEESGSGELDEDEYGDDESGDDGGGGGLRDARAVGAGRRSVGGSMGSEGEGEEDESGDGDEEDEDEESDEDDGYDMMGHMFGASSDEEADGEEDGEGSDSEGGDGGDVEAEGEGEGEDESEEMGTSGASEEDDEEGEGEAARREAAGAAGSRAAAPSGQKYVPPALRAAMAAAGAGGGGGVTADPARAQVERRITGLINRLAESNLQPISREVAELYGSQGRRLVSEAVAAQILGAAESGPRASEQFAAVAAAFVAAVAAQAEAQDLAAAFLGQLAERLEAALGGGDSLAQSNLVTLLGYVYSAGLVGPGLLYGLLGQLRERFAEADVGAMVTLLNAVGLQLRNADPALMKEFVLGVHTRAAELGSKGELSRRAQLMLDLIIDIKNNKTSAAGSAAAAAGAAPVVSVSLGGTAVGGKKGARAAAGAAGGGAGGSGRRGGSLAVLSPGVSKWLQGLGVDEVCLRGLTWRKLLQPNKKGMWWVPAAGEALDEPLLAAVGGGGGGAVAAATDAAASGAGSDANAASTARLLALAAGQRMNTDVRRAVFVAIMGSEDCAEAHEKLLRLPLKGDQRREIMRVLLDCCLAEKAWNPYYALLALRLCGGGCAGGGGSVGRAHRVTAQYCLWDKFKEIESLDVRQLTHLARLAAVLVARFALSLSVLKPLDWADMSAKQTLTWRVFLRHTLAEAKSAGDVKEVFKRLASQPKTLSSLISGLLHFLRSSFGPWLASRAEEGPLGDELLRRTRLAEKELAAGAAAAAVLI